MATWRQMSPAEVPGVLRVGDKVHPDLPEGQQMLEERVKLFPQGCLVLVDGDNNDVCGYAVSHPIRRDRPPALDSLLGRIAPDADQYYIHDIAILPGFRGRGSAADCVRRLLAVARAGGFASACLVSVYGTAPFWGRFGFLPEPADAVLVEKLKGYGDDATYLVRWDDGPPRPTPRSASGSAGPTSERVAKVPSSG